MASSNSTVASGRGSPSRVTVPVTLPREASELQPAIPPSVTPRRHAQRDAFHSSFPRSCRQKLVQFLPNRNAVISDAQKLIDAEHVAVDRGDAHVVVVDVDVAVGEADVLVDEVDGAVAEEEVPPRSDCC